VQAVSDELALHFSALVNRLRELVRGAEGEYVVDVDWWLRNAVLAEAYRDYVYMVARNGLYITIDLRNKRKPYYVIGHLAEGDICAED